MFINLLKFMLGLERYSCTWCGRKLKRREFHSHIDKCRADYYKNKMNKMEELFRVDKMLNLFELASIIKEPLEIDVSSTGFRISFKDSSIKECKNGACIKSEWGVGSTIDIAANDYFRKINKKWIVINAFTGDRREYAAEIRQRGDETVCGV
jgi:hypothetical protein